ncbi:hypothetical protein CFC21_021323 [Triticum aestivum]|uniref:Uncharacterized protein n=3 Tax=Triticum TaxID=4564 RepID=A0A9R1PDB8_TRITD|nr:hypothetical protein CFC21_021323 [Triticum aestivum]VAH41304.1 unnamed protein product [Triticum turgidum subsp. durum]
MAQPYMPVASAEDPEIQESPGNGSSSIWIQEEEEKIRKQAEQVTLSIPPHFPRLDSIGGNNLDFDYPSIFKLRRRAAVGVALASMPTLPQAAASPALDHPEPATSSIMVAAVGPYHRPSSGSLITDAKKCAIVKFLASQQGSGLNTADFLRWAKENDARVQSCYEAGSFTVSSEPSREEETMSSKDLPRMLLLDGCLLLFAVFLLTSSVHATPALPAHDDAERERQFNYLSADMCRNMKQTRLDLLTLSNQIPFFVLAELHGRLKGTLFNGIERSIEELALSCFDDIHPPLSGVIKQAKAGETITFPKTVHHLLHLFHWSRVPEGKHMLLNDSPCLHAEPESHLPCATWFEEWRTSFSKQAAPGGSSLHIVFKREMMDMRGVMHVPAQHIHGYSEPVFRSLIAFEQRHHQCGLGVTAYSICMARLLQTEADAKLLRERGILAHTHQTDKEIVDLFTGLADEYSNTFYSKDLLRLCEDVSAHHKSTPAKAIKWVRLQCFPKQSVTFFVIFGALISFATVINAGYSVYRFYHPLPVK